jgi:hypothetical protein
MTTYTLPSTLPVQKNLVRSKRDGRFYVIEQFLSRGIALCHPKHAPRMKFAIHTNELSDKF